MHVNSLALGHPVDVFGFVSFQPSEWRPAAAHRGTTGHPGPSRRSVAKGAAWSIPAIVVAPEASAVAVSAGTPAPVLTSHTYFIQSTGSRSDNHYSCSGTQQYEITNRSASPASGYITVTHVNAKSKITGLTATYWIPVAAGTTFTPVSGSSSSCWTPPAATGASMTRNGSTFYAYTSDYTCTIVVPTNATSWTMPTASSFDFVSSCQSRSSVLSTTYHYTQNITVDGVQLTKDNGWNNVTS